MTTSSRAKEAVFDTLLNLLKTDRFDSITVTEIIEKSNISRATFYRLFEDKYDLLDKFSFAMLEKHVGYQNIPKRQWYHFCLDFLNQAKCSSSLNRFFAASDSQFYSVYNRFFHQLLIHRMQSCALDKDAISNDELTVLSAILATEYSNWFSNRCRKSPDELIEHTLSFIPPRYIELLELIYD